MSSVKLTSLHSFSFPPCVVGLFRPQRNGTDRPEETEEEEEEKKERKTERRRKERKVEKHK